MATIEGEFDDWEHFMWFFAAHKAHLTDPHMRPTVELESEVGALNGEFNVLVRDYIALYKDKQKLLREPGDGKQLKIIAKEFDLAVEKLKEFIVHMP